MNWQGKSGAGTKSTVEFRNSYFSVARALFREQKCNSFVKGGMGTVSGSVHGLGQMQLVPLFQND